MFISDTKEQVLEKFKSIHGDRYDYSLVKYVGSRFKVKIICKEHGVFECSPSNHLKKDKPRGCPKCGIIKCSKNRSKTTGQFVKEAIDVNGNEYDYTLVDYISDKHKVSVICRKHGEFLVTPNNHLKGKGCPTCGKEKISISKRQYGSDVVNRFKEKHRDSYDYSLVEYRGATVKVKIICPIHGVFEQTPSCHYNGQGCPACGIKRQAKQKQVNPPGWSITNWGNKSKTSKNFDSFKVYIIRCWNDNEEFYKIGRTFLKTKSRFRNKKLMPYNYEVLKEIKFSNAKDCVRREAELKKLHKSSKYIPKIKFDGMHECFSEKKHF